MSKRLIRVLAISLVLIFIISTGAFATMQASYYIITTDAYISSTSGKLNIEFSITATGTMSQLGASLIRLYKADGTLVKTYSYWYYPEMMTTDDFYHGSYVTYDNPVYGEHYYAVVTLVARNSSGSDSVDEVTPLF